MSNLLLPNDLLQVLHAHLASLAPRYPQWRATMVTAEHPGRLHLGSWDAQDIYRLTQTIMGSACAFFGSADVAAVALLAHSGAMALSQVDRLDLALHLGHHWLVVEGETPRSTVRQQWGVPQQQFAHQDQLEANAIHALYLQAVQAFPECEALIGPLLLTAGVVLNWEQLTVERQQGLVHAFRPRAPGYPPHFQIQVRRHPERDPLILMA